MGRSFPFDYEQRKLAVAVVSIDEGWELWIVEEGRRLTCAALVSVDDATEAGRAGLDRISMVADQIKSRVISADLKIGSLSPNDRIVFASNAEVKRDRLAAV
jgi:hypothetical protein